jgi:hypothetical protein
VGQEHSVAVLVGNAHGRDPAVRYGTAQEGSLYHARPLHVGEVFSASIQETAVLNSKYGCADAF